MTQYFILLLFYSILTEAASISRVLVVSRHGDRSPLFPPYPTNPNKAYPWEEGRDGNITSLGRIQSFQFGEFLRKRYGSLLTNDINEISAMSSSSRRCFDTSKCILTGMYKPQEPEYCFVRRSATIAPIDTSVDYMLSFGVGCEIKKEILFKELNSPEVHNMLLERKEFIDKLDSKTGLLTLKSPSPALHLMVVHDAIFIEKIHNLEQSHWVEQLWPELRKLYIEILDAAVLKEDDYKIQIGNMIQELINQLTGKEDSNKVHLYVTHDYFLGMMMRAIGVDYGRLPPTMASLLFELDDKGDTFQLFYRNSTTDPPHPFIVPGCAFDCSVQDFVKIVERHALKEPLQCQILKNDACSTKYADKDLLDSMKTRMMKHK